MTALGKLKEARLVLEARGGVPTGEVLRLSYWIAEMHLAVAEGSSKLDDTELHERMRKGLSMTAGRDLLLLCAWTYAARAASQTRRSSRGARRWSARAASGSTSRCRSSPSG